MMVLQNINQNISSVENRAEADVSCDNIVSRLFKHEYKNRNRGSIMRAELMALNARPENKSFKCLLFLSSVENIFNVSVLLLFLLF